MSRSVCRRDMPRDCAACVWPSSTEMMPARTISAMYAPSLSPKPSVAAANGVMSELYVTLMTAGPPNGTPSVMCLNSAPPNSQNSSCTSSGVPRKNQM